MLNQNQALGEIKPAIIETIKDYASEYNLDHKLITAIILVESRGNQFSIGKDGEIGLMQLHPKFFISADFNYINNIKAGTKYLAKIKKKHKLSNNCWITYYNFGPYSSVKDPCNTSYYKKVMYEYQRI